MKKSVKKSKNNSNGIHIHLTNRWLYALVTLGIFLILVVGVYAFKLTPGVKPNPGHYINETAPPSGCTSGQVLQWTGTSNTDGGWACVSLATNQIGTLVNGKWCTSDGSKINCNSSPVSHSQALYTYLYPACTNQQNVITVSSTCSTSNTAGCYGGWCTYYDCNGNQHQVQGSAKTYTCGNNLLGYLVN